MRNPSRFETLSADDGVRWDEALREVGVYGFWHLAAFHRLAEERGEGRPLLTVFRDRGWTIALPLILREIDVPWARPGSVDATSVAGMAGPAAAAGLPEDVRVRWLDELQGFLARYGIVSVYARLNYTMDQTGLMAGLGWLTRRHQEVVIDLTAPPEEQVAHCRRGHRRQIAKLRSMGFVCETCGPDRVDEFVELYHGSLDEVGADPAFYFDRSYFSFLLREMPNEAHLMRCRDRNGKTAMTVFFSMCNGVLHVLYGGVEPGYSDVSPVKLVIDELRKWGNARRARLMLLGSGRTCADDSLFQFKMGFGGQERVYCTWSHISDPETYEELCHEATRATGREPDDSYFPRYRHPLYVSAGDAGGTHSTVVGVRHGESRSVRCDSG